MAWAGHKLISILLITSTTTNLLVFCSKSCLPLCCLNGQTLIKGRCSIPLERTEEEKREVQKKENCLEEVNNLGQFRKLSFLPGCPNITEYQLKNVNIRLEQVSRTLNRFTLEISKSKPNRDGGSDIEVDMETYFALAQYNKSHSAQGYDNQSRYGEPESIPASFCVDSIAEKVIACPRIKLASAAKVNKCCPFGKELKYPLLSGCIQSEANQGKKRWALRIHGHPHPLQDLIRFPYEFVVHNSNFLQNLELNCSFNNITNINQTNLHHRILFDYDAFQLDTNGNLVYSRPINSYPDLSGRQVDAGHFCVDMVEKDRKQYMTAVYCSPKSMSHVNEDLLVISPPNSGCSLTKSALFILLYFFGLKML